MTPNTIEQDKLTRNFIISVSYIIAGLGLMNVALVFAPYLISLFAYQAVNAIAAVPDMSIFAAICNGIFGNSEYVPYFAALAIILIIASILYIIYFVLALMKKENILKHTVIASVVFLLFGLATYEVNVLNFFAERHMLSVDFADYVRLALLNFVPKTLITSAVANIAMSAIIRYEKKKTLQNKAVAPV